MYVDQDARGRFAIMDIAPEKIGAIIEACKQPRRKLSSIDDNDEDRYHAISQTSVLMVVYAIAAVFSCIRANQVLPNSILWAIVYWAFMLVFTYGTVDKFSKLPKL